MVITCTRDHFVTTQHEYAPGERMATQRAVVEAWFEDDTGRSRPDLEFRGWGARIEDAVADLYRQADAAGKRSYLQ